ncbi:MAG: endolytic transglycosylase MltG [Bacteroidia bacterium]|nr:endolytic transglycosylase MltG [Bacteroidia bacterium]
MVTSVRRKKTKNNYLSPAVIRFTVLIAIFICGLVAYRYYNKVYGTNIHLNSNESDYLYIQTGFGYNQILAEIIQKDVLIDIESFIWVANKKNYKNHIHPGKYKITNGMSNNELLNHLRSGAQEPVKLIFNCLKTKEQFAERISQQLEADSISVINLLNNDSIALLYGFDCYSFPAMFIPNTYEFYWNTSASEFFDRMSKEYHKFWNDTRLTLASEAGLSPVQVSILASIVEEETNKNEEKAGIAGVYINRLNKGMKLEADPTVKFAWQDFSLHRILKKHLNINSPYNTYKYSGLPPGPISFPGIASIESVLNYEKHNYLYFCAKDDFSGYHIFARNAAEHARNARRYQAALNKKNILN